MSVFGPFFLAGSGLLSVVRCSGVVIDWTCCCPFQGSAFFSFWSFWVLSVFPVPSPLGECKPLFLPCGSARALSSRPSPGPQELSSSLFSWDFFQKFFVFHMGMCLEDQQTHAPVPCDPWDTIGSAWITLSADLRHGLETNA